jgi:hypothetical protein
LPSSPIPAWIFTGCVTYQYYPCYIILLLLPIKFVYICFHLYMYVYFISGLRLDNNISLNSMGPQSPLDLKPDRASLMVNFSPPGDPLSPG